MSGAILTVILPIIIAFIGFGVQLMPNHPRYKWLGSIICFGLASIIASGGIAYYYMHETIGAYIAVIISTFLTVSAVAIYLFKTKQIITPTVIIPPTMGVTLNGTLICMHKRLIELQTEKYKHTKIPYKKWEKVIPTLADRVGTVKLKDWPKFQKKLLARIKQNMPGYQKIKSKDPFRLFVERRERVHMAGLIVAAEVKKELIDLKKWNEDDVQKTCDWLDGYHWGLKELRDNDIEWNVMFNSINHYMTDTKLRGLIKRHIDVSYMYNSTNLIVRYGDRYPKTLFGSMLWETVAGKPISKSTIEIDLAKILSQITKRQQLINGGVITNE